MSVEIDKIITWGRSLDEYIEMFSMSQDDLKGNILGCSDGMSSFNAECRRAGLNVVSCDPIYKFSTEDIMSRFNESYQIIEEQISKNRNEYMWDKFECLDKLLHYRAKVANIFIEDFKLNKSEKFYKTGSLPDLPFYPNQFTLALVSYFLFAYANILSLEFHVKSIIELMRVAKEVRIFPIVINTGVIPNFFTKLVNILKTQDYIAEIVPVNYRFHKPATNMLRVTKGHNKMYE